MGSIWKVERTEILDRDRDRKVVRKGEVTRRVRAEMTSRREGHTDWGGGETDNGKSE